MKQNVLTLVPNTGSDFKETWANQAEGPEDEWVTIADEFEEYIDDQLTEFCGASRVWNKYWLRSSIDLINDVLEHCDNAYVDGGESQNSTRSMHYTVSTNDEDALRKEMRSQIAHLIWPRRNEIREELKRQIEREAENEEWMRLQLEEE